MMTPDTKAALVSNLKSPYPKKRKSKDDIYAKDKLEFESTEPESKEHGFFWVYNYALSKKWRSTFTGKFIYIHQMNFYKSEIFL